MQSKDDHNFTSVFGIANTGEEEYDDDDDDDDDDDTVNTTAAITEPAELDILEELPLSLPILMRTIGHNKWIDAMIQLTQNKTMNEFIISIQEIPIGCPNGRIWKYYVQRDTNDKNKLYQITEEYNHNKILLNKQKLDCSQYDCKLCAEWIDYAKNK